MGILLGLSAACRRPSPPAQQTLCKHRGSNGFRMARTTPRGDEESDPLPRWQRLLDLLWPIFVLSGIERVEITPGNTAFLDFVSHIDDMSSRA
jgi:hypothetical protein